MSLIICVLYIAFGTFIYTSVFEALDAVDALYFTIVSRRRSREGQKSHVLPIAEARRPPHA